MKMFRERKAISPVIATVILVAVAITVAVAVSYWMGGISSQYTKFEKVEIQSGWSERYNTSSLTGWIITLELKNTGSASATLVRVFINDVPIKEGNYNETGIVDTETSTSIDFDTGLPLESGAGDTVYIYISDTYKQLSSGTTVDVKIHSAGGMDYIKLISLV
jgi:flagellin-like protein